jgi:hypothetical protein
MTAEGISILDFACALYVRGGPRSVWEEKPAMVNVTGTKCICRSLTASGGRKEFDETAAPLRRCPGVQQSMGHLASSGDAETADVDSGAGAAW